MIQRFQELLASRRMKGSGRVGYCVVVGHQWTGPETSDSSWSCCSQPVDLANKESLPGGKNESFSGGLYIKLKLWNNFSQKIQCNNAAVLARSPNVMTC